MVANLTTDRTIWLGSVTTISSTTTARGDDDLQELSAILTYRADDHANSARRRHIARYAVRRESAGRADWADPCR